MLTSLAHEEPDQVTSLLWTNLTPLFAEKFTKATGSRDSFDHFEADVYDVGFRSHSQTELRQTYGRYHTARYERFGNWGNRF